MVFNTIDIIMILSTTEYMYMHVSPFNNPQGSRFILTVQSMGENEYGKSGHLNIFTSLKIKHLMCFWNAIFPGLHFTPYITDTDNMYSAM